MEPAIRESAEPASIPLLAMAHDGSTTLTLQDGALHLGDVRIRDAAGVAAAAFVDAQLWLVTCDHALERFAVSGRLIGRTDLGALGRDVRISTNRTGLRAALIEGERSVIVREASGDLAIDQLEARGRDRRLWLGGRGIAERRGGAIVFGRSQLLPLPLDLAAARVVGGALVLDGSAALVELDTGKRTAVVYDLVRGTIRTRIHIGDASILAVAERKGTIVLGRDTHVALFDLRAGRCVGERILPAPARAAAIDTNSTRILITDATGTIHELAGSLKDWSIPDEPEPEVEHEHEHEHEHEPQLEPPAECRAPLADSRSPLADSRAPLAARREPLPSPQPQPQPQPQPFHFPSAALLSLSPLDTPPLDGDLPDYVSALRTWILATCRTALAIAADAGRLASPTTLDIDALTGEYSGRASEALDRARTLEAEATSLFGRWNRRGSPHVELSRELGLSPLATSLLILAAAPQIWGELARAYGAIAADPARPLVDELLLSHLLEADTATRAAIGRELDDDSPLVTTGAITLGRGLRPYAALSVHPAIARRLQGATPALDPSADSTTALPLDRFLGDHAAIAGLVDQLARPATSPARVVLRGRAGFGRRTLAMALAARANRGIGIVAIDPGGAAADLEARLRARLHDVALRGDIPCISLDNLPEDPALHARIRTILDRHTGPLFLRAPRTGDIPLSPGYLALELAPLDETARAAAWRTTLAAAGLDASPAASLARRFAVGPGAMARACAAIDSGTTEPEPALAAVLRQHRSTRISALATRVEHLASLDELVVPEEISDALHELVARVHHRRTVLEDWGLRTVATSAYGITALFQGGPGTGKTMAAQAIANALGYELWRVDLSKIVSKWIGETEKNLAAVFDAAEDGEVVLLFDEADSLFGKRTDVKSSNDRNANLETNYLLQRLDAFTGVALLTTNFGTAIDPAFRRRLAVQAQFPFPDDHDRERLWRAHLPKTMPIASDLDLGDLARRYPLTGGYIRNAVLRAAYLAAARGSAVTGADLERAVRAEYAAHGKVSASGAIS